MQQASDKLNIKHVLASVKQLVASLGRITVTVVPDNGPRRDGTGEVLPKPSGRLARLLRTGAKCDADGRSENG